jgi:hypothetical protein
MNKTLLGTKAGSILIIGLVFGACSDSASSVPVPPEALPPTQIESPLEDFLSLLWGTNLSPEMALAQQEAQNVQRENRIAQCMRDFGFDYLPNLYRVQYAVGESAEGLDEREFALTYGYGILHETSESSGVYVFVTGGHPNDPNSQTRSMLTPAEREAWDAALEGPRFWLQGYTFPEWLESQDFSDPTAVGCRLWADLLDETDYTQFRESDEFARFFAALDEMTDELSWGISDADRDWAHCMADAGHSGYERQGDAAANFTAEWNQAQGTYPWGSAEWIEMHSQFQKRELELALLDLDCRVAVDFRERQNTRRIQKHSQFVTDHSTELRALQDAIEQGRLR